MSDIDVFPDGLVYVAAGVGVATLDSEGEWALLDIEGLPEGTGSDDGYPGRIVEQITVGPDGAVWLAGRATSHLDDEEFGGHPDWGGGRILYWVAFHCPLCGEWHVYTSDDVPELEGGVGDMAVAADGTLYASVEGILLVFDGAEWESHALPMEWAEYRWSHSMTVGADGVLWAAMDYWRYGLLAFDGIDFTQHTTEDGFPDNIYQVTAAIDGMVWVATDTERPYPAEAAGVAAFDGTTWTTYTTSDGLLSNHAVIATGADGTVWAVHSDDPPYGYSRFNGTEWTAYQFDLPVGDRQATVTPDGTLWTKDNEVVISFDGISRTIHVSPFGRPGPLVAGGYRIDDFAGGLGTPNDLAVEPNGNLVVSESEAQQVRRIEILPDGSAGVDTVVATGIADAEGLAIGHDGVLYVSGSRQVFRIADGATTPFAEGFNDPEGLAIDRYGDLYVADDAPSGVRISKVEVMADGTAGETTEMAVVPGGTAADIDFGPSGDLFVANDSGAVWEIEFADDGSVDDSHILASFPDSPRTLEFDQDGTLYVGTERSGGWSTTGSVWSMKPGGLPTLFASGFSHVEGLAFDQSGRLYISNVGANQIIQVSPPTGTITISMVGETGTVTVSLDGLQGFEGLVVDAWLLPPEPTEEKHAFGGISLGIIYEDPYSGADVMHPPSDRYFGVVPDEVATFEPGTYRFIIEAYEPSGDMYYGCEKQVQVGGDPTVVSFTSLPTYTGDGWHWTPYDQLEYPDCPG